MELRPHIIYPQNDAAGTSFTGQHLDRNEFYFVTPQSMRTRKATVVLSKTIKLYIKEFIDILRVTGEDLGPVGEQQWTCALTQHLRSRDPRIGQDDVLRWIKLHKWITDSTDSPTTVSTTDTLPQTVPNGTQQSVTPSTSNDTTTFTIPAPVVESPKVGGGGTDNEPERNSVQSQKALFNYLEKISELRQDFAAHPELRAGLAHLDPLANLLTRNIKRNVLKKSRVDAVYEDLNRSGIPQFVKGFKVECDESDVEAGNKSDTSFDELMTDLE